MPVNLIARARGIDLVFEPQKSPEDDVSGFYFREGDRRVIGVNSTHPTVRQRFTIAHELGHAVLHDWKACISIRRSVSATVGVRRPSIETRLLRMPLRPSC